MTARKILTALLFLSAALTGFIEIPAARAEVPASGDARHAPAPRADYERIKVCVLAVCEDDPATEAAIKRAAETALLRLEGVAVSEFLEESSVLISFVAFKERDAQGMQTGRIVFSFAYGTPDITCADGEPVGLPRYLYHEPALAAREMLERMIADKIGEAERDFFHILRVR